jgi:hypothetical protein
MASIWLVAYVSTLSGMRWAFLLLVPGPVLGAIAMRRLEKP